MASGFNVHVPKNALQGEKVPEISFYDKIKT